MTISVDMMKPRRPSASVRLSQRIEQLESRWLLAGLVEEFRENPAPAWFAHSPTDVINLRPTRSSGLATQPKFVGPRQYAEADWIVQLSQAAAQQVGSLADIDRLLSSPLVEVQALRGLGTDGLVQLRTLSTTELLAEHHLAFSDAVGSFNRNLTFQGTAIPNDAQFGNQTGFESSGQFGTQLDADIDASLAWDISTGSSQVVIGVIDSGIDLTHPDLAQNIWINQGEIGTGRLSAFLDVDQDGLITFYDLNDSRNASFSRDINRNGIIDAGDLLADPRWSDGVDTDRNGFVDDFFGWNFRDDVDEPFEPNNPEDTSGHGTHVAGIIGARGNNDIGIAGLNWRTSLMSLKFLDRNNQGDIASAIAAVNYATMMRTSFGTNVRVLNNSWGQAGSFNTNLNDALLTAEAADILIVAAAGNGNVLGVGVDNDRTPFYPASYPLDNLIAVGASDGLDRLAGFSNYGLNSVDLLAPGVGIISTLPGGRYGEANGTSMAAPMVSGTAALIWSALPQASVSEVRQAILSSIDKPSGLQGSVVTGGRLNAASAIRSNVFAPVATLVQAADITTSSGAYQEITVRFSDRNGLDISTIDDNDLQVVHRWGERETLPAKLKPGSVSANLAGTEVTATYLLTPPGGSWDALDFGSYEIQVATDAVRSLQSQRPNRSQSLGTFRVQVATPNVIYVTSYADDVAPTADGMTLRSALAQAAQSNQAYTLILDSGTYQLDRPYQADPGFAFPTNNAPAACGTRESIWSNADWGDLDVLGRVTLIGDGHGQTTIAGATGDRLFKVHAAHP